MRAACLLLMLFGLSLNVAQALESPKTTKPFPIGVSQPAFVGEPIWVTDLTPGSSRYPYLGGDCIRLELLLDGKQVAPRPQKPLFQSGGGGSSSRSIVDMFAAGCVRTSLLYPASGLRLPVHVWFNIQQPGRYSLRWIYVWSHVVDGKRSTKEVSSEWSSFTVQTPSKENHEKWFRNVLEHPPGTTLDVAINQVPSLFAAEPDERALQSLVTLLYAPEFAAAVAAQALAYFPEDRVRTAIYDLFQKKGPTDFIANLVSMNWLGLGQDANRRAEMTRTCLAYLRSSDPKKTAAAIKMIDFSVRGKNPTPTSPSLVTLADDDVLNAAADIAATGSADAQRELISYMRGIKAPDGRRRIISMARSGGAGSDIANAALIYDHAPEATGPLLLENWEHDDAPHGIVIARSYGFTITNLTDSAVSIGRDIAIEKKTAQGWKQSTEVQAVASCKNWRSKSKLPISLASRSSLAVQAWNGFLCGGQCTEPCQQNIYSGPGVFRFVIDVPARSTRISSLPFAIVGR